MLQQINNNNNGNNNVEKITLVQLKKNKQNKFAFYKELLKTLKQKSLNQDKINSLKNKLCKKYGIKAPPTNIQILLEAPAKDLPNLKHLQTKPTRSISGVSVAAIMSAPYACPTQAQCIYCPGGPNSPFGTVPKSYTGHEPSTMRGIRNNYDSYLQVFNRLEQYVVLGHNFDKVELIVMGGTFTSFARKYQEQFITYAFKAMNDFSNLFFAKKRFDVVKFRKFFELPGAVGDKQRTKNIQEKLLKLKGETTLAKEKERNQTSFIKCVGITLETRSDCAKLDEANFMLELGCTRVEIGVQSVYDNVLKYIKRGNTVADNIEAVRILKDLGFKLNFHYMPGLPETTKKMDLAGMKQLFNNSDYKPDMLKIYPCMVFKGTELYKLWQEGRFVPLTTKDAAQLIAEFKPFVARYCRIMRVQRDIPTKMIDGGVDRTNLRQYVDELNPVCHCIRCREVGHVYNKKGLLPRNPEILVEEYEASNGKEFFISYEDKKQDILLGFVRLRFPSQFLRKEITKTSALIRELHVYGEAEAIGDTAVEESVVQHKGIGKKLMQKAEEIARQNRKNKIVVISAVGTRGYYKKLGYHLEGAYMVKEI
ncbi:tRNA uridine(34) 5-carboxymethylaminomethyl modification radical SAM/GNAT enzyme Elp3 [Candidatus Woesearchaeota archaeon]|nr:tRNA uridine(34) 5-carboxymethylaminomethyl modification radical SAM/GNAT enzyme Elp3 [Candidatus Woesearchaeota archaeon]